MLYLADQKIFYLLKFANTDGIASAIADLIGVLFLLNAADFLSLFNHCDDWPELGSNGQLIANDLPIE